MIKAIILAGGEGIRLRPLTPQTHKCLVPILNRPFLEHLLEHLKGHGIQEVVLALGRRHGQIEDYFGDGSAFGMKLHYAVEGSPLGTAGAVRNAGHLLEDTFLVLNGDIFTDLDLGAMLDFHRERGALATIALTQVEDTSAYGVVEMGPEGQALRFLEKPQLGVSLARTVNAGTYVLELKALDFIPPGQPSMFERDVFPSLLRGDCPVYGYLSSGYWIDIGTPQRYLEVHDRLLRDGQRLPGESIRDGVWGEVGCRVHPSARLGGPALLGRDSRVEAGAGVAGPVTLGPGCSLGPGAWVQGSVLWAQVQVGPEAVVEGSIIGNRCSIGAGAYVGPGCVLGDGVRLPPGARLEPGTRLGSPGQEPP